MSTTFRPSDPQSRNDVPSRVELQLLRIKRRMFIWNCINAVFCCWVIVWFWTSSDDVPSAARMIAHGVLNLGEIVPAPIPTVPGRLSPPMIKDGKRLEITREDSPVADPSDKVRLVAFPDWYGTVKTTKSEPPASPPKFKYRYVTETQVNCKTCPGGVCPVK